MVGGMYVEGRGILKWILTGGFISQLLNVFNNTLPEVDNQVVA